MASVVCFSFFSGRLKSQHALNVSQTSWEYTVVELKHTTTKSNNQSKSINQSRVHLRESNSDWPSKDKGRLSQYSRAFFPPLSRSPIFLSVRAFSFHQVLNALPRYGSRSSYGNILRPANPYKDWLLANQILTLPVRPSC